MFRETKIRKLLKSDSKFINVTDFQVTIKKGYNFKITYLPKKAFSLLVSEVSNAVEIAEYLKTRKNVHLVNNNNDNQILNIKYQPNDLLSKKVNVEYINIHQIEQHINTWMEALAEEMEEQCSIKKIKHEQGQINKILNHFDYIDDNSFSVEEILMMQQTLDQLEQQFIEKVKLQDYSEETIEAKLQQLHEEIEVLKQQLEIFSKEGFFRKAFPTFMKWFGYGDSKHIISDGVDMLKHILPAS